MANWKRKLLLLALACASGAGGAVAQTVKDAAEVDPDGHRVVLENAYVRVVEARLPQGKKVALHSHPARVVVAVTGYRLKSTAADGTTTVFDHRPGEAIWVEAQEHAAEVLVGPVHALEIEPKAARPPAPTTQAKDFTEVAADVGRVVLENERVRVVEIRAGAGSKSPWHSHPARVAVTLTSARFKATLPDGTTRISDSRVGQAVWRDAEEHADEVLAGTAHIILVEIKAR